MYEMGFKPAEIVMSSYDIAKVAKLGYQYVITLVAGVLCHDYGIDVKMIAIYTQLSQTGALRSALGLADWSLYWLSVADD